MLMKVHHDTTGLGKVEAERLSAERLAARKEVGMAMIIVRPGLEQTARDSLRRRGIGAWWPNYRKEVQAKDRDTGQRYTKLIVAGVMPGIMFTPSWLQPEFWKAMDLAPGAVNVVRTLSGDVAVMADIDIVLLHKIEADLNKPAPAKIIHKFEVGDDVIIVDGHVMKGFSAKVVKVDKRTGHIHLEILIFNRMTPITVLPEHIAPA